MGLHPKDAEAAEQIDAALFSGVPDAQACAELTRFIARWSARLEQIANESEPKKKERFVSLLFPNKFKG